MIAKLKETWPILTAMVVLSIGIFIADLIFPPEVASGVPYVAVVLLSLWLGSRRAVFLGAGATTVLAVIGFFISYSPGQSRWIGLEDRIIAIAVIWVTASMAAIVLRQEDAIYRAQQKAVQSERLAAIGQTITAMTHEARNELAALQLTLRVLDAHVTDDATRQLAARLWDVQGRLSRLFEDVRGYAAPIHLEKTFASVADVWRAAWESLKPKHRAPTELVEKTSGLDLNGYVDSLRIEQVFRNLFDNSLAACTPPVVIEVSCTEIAEEGKEFLQISVRDNGPGLPPDIRRRVFEPFFTTKPGGTGLGMAICKRFVEAHGGDLRVVDRTEGAEFVLLLPKVQRPQEQALQVQQHEVG